jgi:hypothetical protein
VIGGANHTMLEDSSRLSESFFASVGHASEIGIAVVCGHRGTDSSATRGAICEDPV